MLKRLQVIMVILVLALGACAAGLMIKLRKAPPSQTPETIPPLVRVKEANVEKYQLTVRSQGSVMPRTEINLAAEITGKIVTISPSLAAGGFFETGDALAAIDPRDYELALVRAQAQVAEAEARLAREEAEAELARKEWESLEGQRDPSPLAMRVPQLAEARAILESAKAALEQAERDLEKTKIKAPFAGRVREKYVDIGQFVATGTPVAKIYAVDYAEVRLPLPLDDLGFLDLPFKYWSGGNASPAPLAYLRGHMAGQTCVWTGTVVRMEGEIDQRSRMATAVVRVNDPYGRNSTNNQPPLPAGLFVEVEIQGRVVNPAFVLPRAALRGRDRVLVIDSEQRLRFREVELLRTEMETAIVKAGLENGEFVCLSPLDTPVEGMQVRIADEAQPIVQTQISGASQ